jgi:4-hydroxythreonine-4-phosphate dehydrogenase
MVLGDVTVIDYAIAHTLTSGNEPSRSGGNASKTFVEDAITDALRPCGDPRRLDALVTAPISKESWALAGFRWPGHTELLAMRTKTKRQAMAFVSPRLNVVLATAHVPLMEIRDHLTIGRVHEPIVLGHELCQQLGIAKPRIAVCGLNPHAGENGIFGDEERRIIKPAIDMARSKGIDVQGPFPGDTIFIEAASGGWDLVVAMYHDQGLIPVKLLGFDKAVNVTLGLPIVRTSPDHGTAFGISGKNKASDGSMRAAIALAVQLCTPHTADVVRHA